MAVWTEVINTDYDFPNIDIYNRLEDGELNAYVARAQEGYVFYDTNANDTELLRDPETGDFVYDDEGNLVEVPVTYYYTIRIFPKTYNMNNFSLVAVSREGIDENYIFGDVSGDHEVM